MKNILLARNASVLSKFVHPRSLFVFDFDGTLAEIVKRPAVAKFSPSMREIILRLSKTHRCAVVTGRSLASIQPKVAGIPFIATVGNHGMEWEGSRRTHIKERKTVAGWASFLEEALRSVQGVEIENKIYTLSVHYRSATDPAYTRGAIRRALRKLSTHRCVAGKEVFNIVPPGMPHKGDALLALMKKFRATHAIFFGDDVTDEDAFALKSSKILGVHIGTQRVTQADYYVRNLAEMEVLLEELTRRSASKKN